MPLETHRKLVNLGCGRVYHKEWDNFDIAPIDANVKPLDLNQDLPFSSNSVHAIYSSHVFEHLTRYQALFFLRECKRVLCAGSTLRLVVPDLEVIVRLYLENLEKALSGDHAAAQRYQWIMLELFDQLIRTQSGGEMLSFWHKNPFSEENFIRSRMGEEYDQFLKVFRSLSPEEQVTQQKIIQQKLMKRNEQTGSSFLETGERHHWMYDRYSLSLILQEQGFEEIKICTATESCISNFSSYYLDADINRKVRKPDSLFIEAIKSQS